MANEINYSLNVMVTNEDYQRMLTESAAVDQAAIGGASPGLLDIGTTEENISFGDVTPGLVFMKMIYPDVEETANVQITWGLNDASTMRTLGVMFPGDVAIFRLETGATIRCVASPVEAQLYVSGYEN